MAETETTSVAGEPIDEGRRIRMKKDSWILFSLLAIYGVLLAVTGLVAAKPIVGSLSTFNGATLLGFSSIGTQEVIGVLAVGFLFFNEIADQRYGKTRKSISRLRASWTPIVVLLLALLLVTVVLKIMGFS